MIDEIHQRSYQSVESQGGKKKKETKTQTLYFIYLQNHVAIKATVHNLLIYFTIDYLDPQKFEKFLNDKRE
jgi:hypothetical protein